MKNKAVLVLADGRYFEGESFGANISPEKPVVGEVVFNTSMYGYQEIITDPSYAGQLMCFTTAQIGNVGCNELDVESSHVHAMGVIVKNYSDFYSNYRAKESLGSYLKKNNIPGIAKIDTRSLVQHLRDHGAQMGAIACGENIDISLLVAKAREAGSMEGKNYVRAVSCQEAYSWSQLPWDQTSECYPELTASELQKRPHLVALDFGIKFNILRLLSEIGFRVTVLPAYSTAKEIRAQAPDALFLSNGPGDPATLMEIVAVTKELISELPIFGICLGHQILCQALGGKTYKLKFGHRGGNHPVLDCLTRKVEITSQNHGFAVQQGSLSKNVLISHVNLNDQTVEGLADAKLKVFSVQYHPEASPGPHDSNYLFQNFYNLVVNNA